MKKEGNLFVALVWITLLILASADTLKKMNAPFKAEPTKDFSNEHP